MMAVVRWSISGPSSKPVSREIQEKYFSGQCILQIANSNLAQNFAGVVPKVWLTWFAIRNQSGGSPLHDPASLTAKIDPASRFCTGSFQPENYRPAPNCRGWQFSVLGDFQNGFHKLGRH
jgi:hypothetical protein